MRHFARVLMLLGPVIGLVASAPTGVRASDCNDNGIDDATELAECPNIDLVVLIDTSTSAQEVRDRFCNEIYAAVAELRGAPDNLTINDEYYIIGPPTGGCICCQELVTDWYGSSVPEMPELPEVGSCGDPTHESDREDWGPAVGVVAANKTWGPGARIIVFLTDEGPRCGDPVNDEGDDRDAITCAITLVSENRVIVFAVLEVDVIPAVIPLADDLVRGGAPGGKVRFYDPDKLASQLAAVIRASCPTDCNENGIIDSCDIDAGTTLDCFGYESNCCVGRQSAGCDDEYIEECVCGEEVGFPECCDTLWDASCVEVAAYFCEGCDPFPNGIPDECEPGPDCNGN